MRTSGPSGWPGAAPAGRAASTPTAATPHAASDHAAYAAGPCRPRRPAPGIAHRGQALQPPPAHAGEQGHQAQPDQRLARRGRRAGPDQHRGRPPGGHGEAGSHDEAPCPHRSEAAIPRVSLCLRLFRSLNARLSGRQDALHSPAGPWQGRTVGWEEDLFAYLDDLEGQAAALYDAERAPELADRSRAEYQQVTLASRLMASVDHEVTLELPASARWPAELARVATGWCLLRGPGQDWVVRLDASARCTAPRTERSPRSPGRQSPGSAWPRRCAASPTGRALLAAPDRRPSPRRHPAARGGRLRRGRHRRGRPRGARCVQPARRRAVAAGVTVAAHRR